MINTRVPSCIISTGLSFFSLSKGLTGAGVANGVGETAVGMANGVGDEGGENGLTYAIGVGDVEETTK